MLTAVHPILPLSSLLQLFPQVLLPEEKNLQASTLRNMMQNTDGRLLTEGWLEVERREVVCNLIFNLLSVFLLFCKGESLSENRSKSVQQRSFHEKCRGRLAPSQNVIEKGS